MFSSRNKKNINMFWLKNKKKKKKKSLYLEICFAVHRGKLGNVGFLIINKPVFVTYWITCVIMSKQKKAECVRMTLSELICIAKLRKFLEIFLQSPY